MAPVKGVHPTTVMTWVEQIGELLPDRYDPDVHPEVGKLDELEIVGGSKKTKSGSGLPLATLEKGFEGGFWATIVLQRAVRSGRSLRLGSAISISLIVGVFTQNPFHMQTKL